jgi:hypothetical protein
MSKSWLLGWPRDQLLTWLVTWIWGLPFVAPLVYGLWAYVRGPLGPEVFLGVIVAFGTSAAAAATFKSQMAISRAIRELRTLAAAGEERSARPVLVPTVDMLEAGRRAAADRRDARIAAWRAMVADVHKEIVRQDDAIQQGHLSPANVRTALSLLEADERFLTLHRRLSDRTKQVLWPTRGILVPPDDGSTMDIRLRCVLVDIDSVAAQWGID